MRLEEEELLGTAWECVKRSRDAMWRVSYARKTAVSR